MIRNLSCFKQSYAVLQNFLRAWIVKLEERCKTDNYRLAAFYIWARYTMSIRTIESLLNPALLPDIAVICRGCIEFDASLEAVLNDKDLAKNYLEFEKHAKARYLKLLAKQEDLPSLLKRLDQFEEQFDDSPDNYGWDKWCARKGGITGILKMLNRTVEMKLYSMLSHFAHGSVVALQILNGRIEDPSKYLAQMVDAIYGAYLKSTCSFLDFAWGPIATVESETCKSEFAKLHRNYEHIA